jgi:hypothetical protein
MAEIATLSKIVSSRRSLPLVLTSPVAVPVFGPHEGAGQAGGGPAPG